MCVGGLGVGAKTIFSWHCSPLGFPVGLGVGEEGPWDSVRGLMIGEQGGGS